MVSCFPFSSPAAWEELQLLQEQGSYVGEVVRAMDKKSAQAKVKAAGPVHQPPAAFRTAVRV